MSITEQDYRSLNASCKGAWLQGIVVSMDMTLGAFVKNRMSSLGLKPRDVSVAIDRSESYVSMLSNDKIATPPPDVVFSLANVLEVDEESILRHMGYFWGERDSHTRDTSVVSIGKEDPRFDLLDLMEDLSREDMEAAVQIVRLVVTRVNTVPMAVRRERDVGKMSDKNVQLDAKRSA